VLSPSCFNRNFNKFREANEEPEPEIPGEAEDELESQHESSEDEEPLPAVRSYAALMESFAAGVSPQAKRRKLDQTPESRPTKVGQEEGFAASVEDADEVQEPEEGPETATDGLLEEDEDDLEDASDPFEAHFADPGNVLSRRLKSLEKNLWTTQKLSVPKFGKVTLSFPGDEGDKSSTGLKPISGPAELKLKQKLAGFMSKERPEFDDVERYIAPAIFSYQDVLYCERRPTNSESLRRLACLHAINHVFK
jgi:U3 small nucleolar RNA-associated protein 25